MLQTRNSRSSHRWSEHIKGFLTFGFNGITSIASSKLRKSLSRVCFEGAVDIRGSHRYESNFILQILACVVDAEQFLSLDASRRVRTVLAELRRHPGNPSCIAEFSPSLKVGAGRIYVGAEVDGTEAS